MENNIYLFGVKLLHLSSSAFLISLIQLDNKWLNIFLFRHTNCAIWRHLSSSVFSSCLSIFQLRLFFISNWYFWIIDRTMQWNSLFQMVKPPALTPLWYDWYLKYRGCVIIY
jgi:hypothetical protein